MEALPQDLAARLWSRSNPINAKAGKTIVALGALSDSVYIVLAGRVQVTLFSHCGREVILRDLGPGDIFGELAALDGQPRSASIVAVADCALASIGAEPFRAAISELPAGAIWLARRLTGQIRHLTERVFELNALRVRSRLHCELLRMCGAGAAKSEAITIEPSPTHAELASRVGTHREAVTREMRRLVSEEILRQDGRRLTIVDVTALEQLVRLATGEDMTTSDFD